MNPAWEIRSLPDERSHARIGRPMAISTAVHALLLFFLGAMAQQLALKPMEPIRVLEINVMGAKDLALKGTGNDYAVGPLPDKTLLAQPAKKRGKVVQGNANKVASMPVAPPSLPTLSARGPLFSSAQGGVTSGVGREKIYMSAPVKVRPQSVGGEKGGEGDGLVGVTGAPIDLNAKRGAGGSEGGTSNFLAGGDGSVNGGSVLSRRGQAVIVNSGESDDPVLRSRRHTVKLENPSDDFFSISGPLSGRKILKLVLPKYPRWAEEQGLEALIALRITVTARGKVKADIMMEQTSGFPEFDNLVLDTVRKMVFAPLPADGGNLDQWGVVTFNFNLKKKGG